MFTADGCRSCTVYTETSCLLYFMAYDDVRTRVPPFVIQAMREWGDTLYGQQANDELQQQMTEERRWKRWKQRILAGRQAAQRLSRVRNDRLCLSPRSLS